MSDNLFQQLGAAIKGKIASEVNTLNLAITAAQAVDSAARTALESSLQGEISSAQAVDSAARTALESSLQGEISSAVTSASSVDSAARTALESSLQGEIAVAQAVDSAARTALESSLQGEISAAQAVDSSARAVINGSVSNLETKAGSLAADGNSANFSGNVTGANGTFTNLTVNGTTTTIDTDNVIVKDSIMSISAGASVAANASNDSGFIVERGSSQNNVGFVWDEGIDRFRAVSTSATAATSDIDGTDSSMSYVPMQASDLFLGTDSVNTIFTKVADLGTASDFSTALNGA